MSVENLKEYTRRCAEDPELRARAKEIGMTDMDAHIRHAKSLGLEWTAADMAGFRKEVIDAEGEGDDLDDERLEQVAGGVMTVTAAVLGAVVVGGVVVGSAAASAGAGGATAAGDGGW